MPLVISNDELARAPFGLVHVRHERNTIGAQHLGGRLDIVGLEVQVKVVAVFDERNRRVAFIGKLEVENPPTGADAGIEATVVKSYLES